MIARSKRPHFPALPVLRELGYRFGPLTRHAAALLGSIQIRLLSVAGPLGPLRAVQQHGIQLLVVEIQATRAAYAGWNVAIQCVGQRLLD